MGTPLKALCLCALLASCCQNSCPTNPPPIPVISPAAGTYSCPFNITITDSGSNSILYTTNGQPPISVNGAEPGNVVSYSTPFAPPPGQHSVQIQAVASAIGSQSVLYSPIATANYLCSNVAASLPEQLQADEESISPGGTNVTEAPAGDELALQPGNGVTSSATGSVHWCAGGVIVPAVPCTNDLGTSTFDTTSAGVCNHTCPVVVIPPNLPFGKYTIVVEDANHVWKGYVPNFIVDAGRPKISVVTQRYNNQRTGVDNSEPTLNVAAVGGGRFQQLYQVNLDGAVYAQPLLVSNVQLANGTQADILLVATMHNSLYAFKVDSGLTGTSNTPPAPLWSINFGASVPANFMGLANSTCTQLPLGNCIDFSGNGDDPSSIQSLPPITSNPPDFNINPEIGILSTPVVDAGTPASGIGGSIYGVSALFQGGNVSQEVWSVDLATGKLNGTQAIFGSVEETPQPLPTAPDQSGPLLTFNTRNQMQRPALLLVNGMLYVAFGSHQDTRPWHGWIFQYGASNGTLSSVKGMWISTPTAMAGGIWQAGSGLAADPSGNIYAMTGNGEPQTDNVWSTDNSQNTAEGDFADAFVQLKNLNPGLFLTGSFIPNDNEVQREQEDLDVGSSGPVILQAQSGDVYLVGGEKKGEIFVLDTRRAMQQRQVFQGAAAEDGWNCNPVSNDCDGAGFHHIHGTPVLWRNSSGVMMLYVWAERDFLNAYTWSDTQNLFNCAGGSACSVPGSTPNPVMVSPTSAPNCAVGPCSFMPGGMLSLSAAAPNPGGLPASGTGVLWASIPIDQDGLVKVVPGVLFAFNAENLSNILWSSTMNVPRDGGFYFAKFVPPTIANGRVYLATFGGPSTPTFGGNVPLNYITGHGSVNVYGVCTTSVCHPAILTAASPTPIP